MSEIKLNDEKSIDLQTLIDTRLLIQANSGGGKSWCIRRILEQSHGKVQQIVIDLEGEFSSLREKYDYVLAGKGGDTPADPRSAALLARRLLELNVSAIIDLFELKPDERKRFVRLFLDSLVNAPKDLWHPAIIVIDEAHVFCPEKGSAESSGSVIDLATRGRKRGYCAILATQRISKLHKDAAAECNNKLIGRTGLDIDRKRASEELGFTSQAQSLELRTLDAGEFFAFGPAISNDITKVRIGSVSTTHPKAGSRIMTKEPAPPTDKIRSVLGKLADLPQEAVQEAQTIDDLKRQIIELKRVPKTIQMPAKITEAGIKQALEPHLIAFRSVEQDYKNQMKILNDYIDTLERAILAIADRIKELAGNRPSTGKMSEYIPLKPDKSLPAFKEMLRKNQSAIYGPLSEGLPTEKTGGTTIEVEMARTPISNFPNDNKPLGAGEKKILAAAAQHGGISRQHLTVLTGYKRSSRDTYLQRLKQAGYVDISGFGVIATPEGIEALGSDYQPLPTGEALREHLLSTLPEGEKKILSVLIEIYPRSMERDELSMNVDYQRSSRDTYLQRLKARDLIAIEGKGLVKASDHLFT